MASIGVGTIGASFLQSQGWKLITNLVNKDTKVGLFTVNGDTFDKDPTGSKNSSNSSSETHKSTTLGGKALDAVSGALDNFSKTLTPDLSINAGAVNLDYTRTTEITDAPLMSGQFLSYNKTVKATQAQINYVTTGTEKQRKTFEKAVEKARLSFGLFTLHTVELTIPYVNIIGYSTKRDPTNIQMYNVSITVREVMQKARSTTLANATASNGTSRETGELQTSDATGSQVQSAKKTAA